MKEYQLDLFDASSITADQILDGLNPDLRNDDRLWPSILAELVDIVADMAQERWHHSPESAIEKAQDVAVAISHYLGGRTVYLPRDDRLKRAIRDIAVYRAFDGSNHLALAKKTGLTTTQIYNIIAKQRKLRYEKGRMARPIRK